MIPTELLESIMKIGVWPTLFILLLLYVMKETKARESEMRATINKVNDQILKKTCDTHELASNVVSDVTAIDTKVASVEVKVDAIDRKADHIIDKFGYMSTSIEKAIDKLDAIHMKI
jgi:seryl-tRNA synthetase